MPESITQWLERLGLEEYATLFVENAIDGEVLPELTDDDLEKLGVKLGHRKKLFKAIAALSAGATRPATPEGAPTTRSNEADETHPGWERSPGQRKPVTMLFADVTGSTAMTERLDPEDAHDLLYGATRKMCQAVEDNRGTVCRFMGDGIMAMFGAPVASEHHAVEACAAALAMQDAMRGDGADGLPEGVRIRVGLHSGEVVVLTIGEGDSIEYDASGPTVPIAARMEQSAEPGEIFLTASTLSLAGGRIDAEPVASLTVKGVTAPIAAFRLHRIQSPDELAPLPGGARFVGRRAELAQLRACLDTCIAEHRGQTVYIRGEPGIGKTTLAREFAGLAAASHAAIHRGLVLPFGVGRGQDAIRSLTRSLLGVEPGDAEEERRRAASAALGAGRLKGDQAVFVNDLLDLPQPPVERSLYDAMENATRNEGKRAVVSSLIATSSESQPTVVVVEDVHWADTLTLAHLSTVARTVAGCRALLVVTSRIEGDQLDQSWREAIPGSPFVTVDLGPLREQEAIELVGGVIDPDDALARTCLERAAGNPLFLEQLSRNAQDGSADSLPDSIQSLVLARMDRLDSRDKRALQAASVVGQRFGADILCSLLGDEGYDCHSLVQHNLIREDGRDYLFTHALIQESIYGSLVKAQRRELHGRAARWFEQTDPVLHAEHLARAGDGAAPAAFLIAAREEADGFRMEKALALAERGLDLAPGEERFGLQSLRGELLRSLGSTHDSIDVYRQAKAAATSDVDRCSASIGIAEGLRIIEAHAELLDELAYAEGIASEHDLSISNARVRQLRGGVFFLRGESEACIGENRAALEFATSAGSAELMAQAYSGLGDAEYARGRIITARGHFDECIRIGREQRQPKTLAANLPMRGAAYRCLCEFERAQADFEEAISLSRETGQARAEMIAVSCGEWLFEWGNLDVGERWVKREAELAERLGSRMFLGEALCGLGRIAHIRGRREEAVDLVEAGLEQLREGGMQFMGPGALGMRALVTRDPNRRSAALREGEDLLRGPSISHNYFFFYPDAMETCLDMGRWDEVDRYAQALEDYTSAEPLPLTDFYIARGRVLARFGRGDRDDAVMSEIARLRNAAERVQFKAVIPALDEALSS